MLWVVCAEEVERTTLKWKDGRYGLASSDGNLEAGTVLYSSFSSATQLFSYEASSPAATVAISLVSCTGAASLYVPPQQADSPVTYEIGTTEVIAHFYKSPAGVVHFMVNSAEPGKYRLSVQREGQPRNTEKIWVERMDDSRVLVEWEPLEMVDGSELPGLVSYQVYATAELSCMCLKENAQISSVFTRDQSVVLPVDNLSSFVVSVVAEMETPHGKVEIPYLESDVQRGKWTSGEIARYAGLVALSAVVVAVYVIQLGKRSKDGDFQRLD
jgi:hypothetical protein